MRGKERGIVGSRRNSGREEERKRRQELGRMRGWRCPSTIPTTTLLPFLTFVTFSNELCSEEPSASSQYLQVALIPPEKSRGSQNRDLALHTDRTCCLYSSLELPLHVASRLHSWTLKQALHLRESWPSSCGSIAGMGGQGVNGSAHNKPAAPPDLTFLIFFIFKMQNILWKFLFK